MKKEKLGMESAFPTLGWEKIGSGKILNVTDTPGISKRLFIAMNCLSPLIELLHLDRFFSNSILKLSGEKKQTPTEYLIKMAYEYTDELLKQENL